MNCYKDNTFNNLKSMHHRMDKELFWALVMINIIYKCIWSITEKFSAQPKRAHERNFVVWSDFQVNNFSSCLHIEFFNLSNLINYWKWSQNQEIFCKISTIPKWKLIIKKFYKIWDSWLNMRKYLAINCPVGFWSHLWRVGFERLKSNYWYYWQYWENYL